MGENEAARTLGEGAGRGMHHASAARPSNVSHSAAECHSGLIRVTLEGSFTAGAAGIVVSLESRRRGSPVCALARRLLEAGHDAAAELHVWRDGTLCFPRMALGRWAGLTVEEGASGSARFRAWRPMPSARRAVARLSGRVANSGAETPAGENGALPGGAP